LLELAVLASLKERVIQTNARLGVLVDAGQSDGLRAAFGRLIGRPVSAPVVDHE
jgi:hypothetical protein